MKKELLELSMKGTDMLRKNGPVVAVVLGIGLGIGAAILASKETPHYLEARERMLEEAEDHKVSKTDEVKCFVKHYWKPIAIEALSIGSIVTGTKMNLDKISALSAACVLSDKAYRELNDKLTNVIGETKVAEVKQSIVHDHAEAARDAVTSDKTNDIDEDLIEHTGFGTQLCWFDPIGKIFRCDRDVIEKAEIALEHRLLDEHWITINDFLQEIHLRPIGGAGDLVGWDVWQNQRLNFKYSWIDAPNSKKSMLCIYSDTCTRSCR